MIKLVECPRDAMQGIHEFIPTEKKIEYINTLLKVGFDTIDFGSFVSPKAIPQMADTEDVLKGLDLSNTKSKLLAIVGNSRGAEVALQHDEISYLGFPFSVSETFQRRNVNSSIARSLDRVESINNLCTKANRELVVYVSMGFGNPYGEPWNFEIVSYWVEELIELGIKAIAPSDTIGIANRASISYLFKNLIPAYPQVGFGAHLHTTPDTWEDKVRAAYKNGCTRFDGAIRGFGGCPMAMDELTGNMPTENLVAFFDKENVELGIDREALNEAIRMATEVFPN